LAFPFLCYFFGFLPVLCFFAAGSGAGERSRRLPRGPVDGGAGSGDSDERSLRLVMWLSLVDLIGLAGAGVLVLVVWGLLFGVAFLVDAVVLD